MRLKCSGRIKGQISDYTIPQITPINDNKEGNCKKVHTMFQI